MAVHHHQQENYENKLYAVVNIMVTRSTLFKITFIFIGKRIIVETVIDHLQIRLRVTLPVQHFIFISTE